MKKILVVLMAVALWCGTGLTSLSFAEEMNKMPGTHTMMKSDMMAKGEMMARGSMHGMMMKGMMEKSMIATSDGGVIISVGNKLMKYDKSLNLVKEVEIKIDMEAMQKNMKEMMKNCSMMKDGMMWEEEEEKSEQK